MQLLDDCRVALSGGGPLFALRVLVTQPAEVPLPTQVLILDEQIRRLLLGEPGLDSRLAGWCRLGRPSATDNLPEPLGTALRVGRVVPGDDTIRLTLGGRRGLGQGSVAGAIAALTGRSVLEVDLDAARSFGPARARDLFAVLVREAALQDAVLDLVPAEALADESWLPRLVGDAVERAGVSTVLRNRGSGPARRLEGIPMISVDLILPGPNERRTLWAAAAHHQGLRLDDSDLDVLAQRYRLAGADIRAAVARAVAASRLGLASSQPAAACAAQARTTGGDRLAELATRIEPRFGWADLVLQTATTDQLHELCARVAVHAEVLADWGFARKLSLGRGLAALFAGPSGTGKSMAAEVVAGQLGLDLYRVDLATVVDKYIGETEKNLDAVFRAAEDANGILLFDEADALFGRRSEVRDAHDRYANLEISYLLQRIEQYDGTAILSTNLHANLDDAFLRRLTAIIWFPFPDAGQRAELWRRTWPAELPLAELDYIDLASRFPLCGGNIKAAALAAAGLARADGGVVTSHHVRHAVAREYEKLGRTLTAEELGAPAVAP
ncbi:MAG TPA: ATP-binding protein [Actinomycetes bacterium]